MRRQTTLAKIRKRLNDVKEISKTYYEDIIKRKRKGHFRKSSSFDCGNSHCHLCHFDKLLGKRPIKEQLFKDEVENEEIRRN